MKPALLTVLLLLATSLAVTAEDPAPGPVERPHALLETSLGRIELELFADETPRTVANFLDLAEGRKEFRDLRTGETVKRPFFDGLVFHRVIQGFMIQGGRPRGDGTGDPGYRFEDEIDAAALGLDGIQAFTPALQPHQYLMSSFRSSQEMRARLIQPLFRKMGIGSQEQLAARKAEVEERLRKLTLKEAYEIPGYVYRSGSGSHPPVKGVIAMANSGPATNGSQFFINLGDTPHLAGKHTVFGRVIAGMDVVEAIGAVKTGANDRPVEPVKILSIRRK